MRRGKRSTRSSITRIAVLVLAACVIIAGAVYGGSLIYARISPAQEDDVLAAGTVDNATEPATEPVTTEPVTEPATEPATTTEPSDTDTSEPETTSPVVLNEYGIYSKAALLLKLDTGEEMFSLLPDQKMYPASLTKILTAIVVIENKSDVGEEVTITEEMLAGLVEAYATVAGFAVDEVTTIRDLLYALMLPSAADAANALAISTAGSLSGFVDMMNEKAAEIGMESSSFANAHGLHDENLYSTCRDMAKLLAYSLENEFFRKVFTTGSYITAETNKHSNGIRLTNSMYRGFSGSPLAKGKVIGSKTGFTTPARQCLASLAEIEDTEYILITMGAGLPGYFDDRYHMLDAIELYGRIK